MISPYIISGPVSGKQFYNRQDLLAEITGGQHRAMYIIGGRQIGKTSLLKQIKLRHPALELDVQLAAGNIAEFAEHLLDSLEELGEQMSWPPSPTSLKEANFFKILQTVIKAAKANQKLIYLLIDESDGLISDTVESRDFLYRLRGLSQKYDNLRLVLAATRRLSKANVLFRETRMSPFLDGFTPFFLNSFSNEDASNLLRAVNIDTPLEISSDLEDEIIHLSGGHPHFLQQLGYRLYKNSVWEKITEEILEQVDHIADGLFANDFATLTNTERQILKLVSQADELSFAELQANITEARLSILLEGLVAHGYLRRLESAYTTGSVFLDRWLEGA